VTLPSLVSPRSSVVFRVISLIPPPCWVRRRSYRASRRAHFVSSTFSYLFTMAANFPVPTKDQFLSISCINVGVGPGGTTSMLAYALGHMISFFHKFDRFGLQTSVHRKLYRRKGLRHFCRANHASHGLQNCHYWDLGRTFEFGCVPLLRHLGIDSPFMYNR
jgi:hypothetical protein